MTTGLDNDTGKNVLSFNAATGIQKTKISQECPFCNVKHLSNIIDCQEEMVLLENKYPTLEGTTQLVLIESAQHDGDVANYDKDKWVDILSYAIHAWNQLTASERYISVLLYKNFGPQTGGSQKHPHMQIVGLKEINGYAQIEEFNFSGPMLQEQSGVIVNVSDRPIMGFFEVNIIWKDNSQLEVAAEKIQNTVKYILKSYYDGLCDAYNLFFYKINGDYICKVVPRFVASPYFIGYKIGQKFNDEYVRYLKDEYQEYCYKISLE